VITKLQKLCLWVFILFNIFDLLVTSWGVGFLGGQEQGIFFKYFSSNLFIFIITMIFIKSLAIIFFYHMIIIFNRLDPDHPEIYWNAGGNFVAAMILSTFPIWMVIMAFLNWPLG